MSAPANIEILDRLARAIVVWARSLGYTPQQLNDFIATRWADENKAGVRADTPQGEHS